MVHGLLHLMGYDDHHPAARRELKKREKRAMQQLASRFDFDRLCNKSNVSAKQGYSSRK
jgi:hypothetical protein